jgi:hypothetical protein
MNRLTEISEWMLTNASGRLTLLSVVVFAVFIVWALPTQSAAAETYAAGAGSVDTRLTYSVEDVYRIAEAYGEQGRRAYVQARLTFDVVWPLAYAAFLSLATSWLVQHSAPGKDWLRRLNLLALGGLLFDYLENLTISIVMAAYPGRLDALAQLSAIFTPIKWVLVGSAFVALGLVAGYWIAGRLRSAGSKLAR